MTANSPVITFDAGLFRVQCPIYSNVTTYPDILIQGYWDTGANFVSTSKYGWLTTAARTLALNYMAGHLIGLNAIIASGQTPGQVQSATIDKISVTMTPPPDKNQWQWWLNLTPYGQMLLALLQVKSVGGWYVGGLPETAALAKVGGVY